MLYASSANYKVLASSQITITDQTDAANLAGHISIVKGSKSQIYMTGTNSPYVPNWSLSDSHLVIRPYLIASSIFANVEDAQVNPDLFDPWLYPDLSNPGSPSSGAPFINPNQITWTLIDAAGNRTPINVTTGDDGVEDEGQDFGHVYTYLSDRGNKTIKDKRQLVIKNNIIEKDSIASIEVKFSFRDPFANIFIPVVYSIELSCISTGAGATKAVINPTNGASFYNGESGTIDEHGRNYLLAVAEYYKDGVLESPTVLEQLIENNQISIEWAIRSGSTPGGWAILDSLNQDTNPFNDEELCYEICKVTGVTPTGEYQTQKVSRANGATALKIYRGLIAGMDVIRLTITDDRVSGQESSTIQEYFDYSDPTLVEINSSGGEKLVGGAVGQDKTTLKAVVRHNGKLLADDSPDYGEGEHSAVGIFDYYWYRLSGDSKTTHNMWVDTYGTTHFTDVNSIDYRPKKGLRKMEVGRDHIDKKAIFTLDLVDKQAMARAINRANLLESLPNMIEIQEAKNINLRNGVPANDRMAIITTAYELKAYNEGRQKILINKFYEKANNKTSNEDK